ncbi:MAG: DUF5103 domain-containing protein [Cyclobacteriaceae bacterium]|nr:MAG: DUF5103 domain-containing protein [Cyclobacteriaceae bacterium]
MNSSSSYPKKLLLDNHVYEENIKTVRLYPIQDSYDEAIQPAVLPLQSARNLVLEFDQLFGDFQSYYARLVHCNANWEKSQLSNNDILAEFNEFPITDYQYSFGTRTPYVHYQWMVPQVKRTGNYVIKVFRQGNEADLILTRRFMVYDNRVQIDAIVGISDGIVERDFNQQLNFSIGYPELPVRNPLEEFNIVIRQNKRWDNALRNLPPTSVKEDLKTLEYRYFNLENNFQGGNEFRFFDLRSINILGQNIASIDRQENRVDAFILRDELNKHRIQGTFQDINGEYVIDNLESDPPTITSDYVFVHFFLESPPRSEDVFIFGALSDWKFTDDNLMNYDTEINGYTNSMLLKQGWYNYIYYLPQSENPYYYEGSYFQTENLYEILVYYRPVGALADQLVGYSNIIHNRRP